MALQSRFIKWSPCLLVVRKQDMFPWSWARLVEAFLRDEREDELMGNIFRTVVENENAVRSASVDALSGPLTVANFNHWEAGQLLKLGGRVEDGQRRARLPDGRG